jgi:preprotein translocase subunit SecG
MDFLIWILFIAVVGLIGLRLISEEKFNQLKDFLKNRYKR